MECWSNDIFSYLVNSRMLRIICFKKVSCLFPDVWTYESSSTRTNSIEFVSDVMSPWDSVFSDLYYTLGSESSVGLISA